MFPAFFASAPNIRMYDPLAEFLGSAQGGVIAYGYADAVRLTGHSCPTVASAFLMTRVAMHRLYGTTLPVRGDIRVDFRDGEDRGVTGVLATVTSLITGATNQGGFRGLAGQFNRRDKLFFNRPIAQGMVRFTRLDSGKSVEMTVKLAHVPGDSRLPGLMAKCLEDSAQPDERALFRTLWQDRVKCLLLEHADDETVFVAVDGSKTHG